LIATDEPGHGSMPQSTSAPTRLIQALNRIYETPFEPRIVEPVQRMFEAISAYAGPEWQDALRNIHEAINDPEFLRRFQAERPDLHALVRNTCSITMLAGSDKINVVPPIASAELDCRILPDQDAQQFLEEIASRVNDDHIRIEEIMLFGAAQSNSDTGLFRLLEEVTQRYYPATKMIPAVSTGFTDSHFFRDIGITSYGYSPMLVPEDHIGGAHGNDERIGIDTFEQGVEMMTEIVGRFASSHSSE
jgi:acetylornithine deacetylase/succinyl-diaminopimelate desuccinylase-like protein